MAGTAGNIDWVYLMAFGAEAHAGDLVSSEAGGLPIYRIVKLREGRVWLKDLEDGSDRVASLSAFPWKALPSASR